MFLLNSRLDLFSATFFLSEVRCPLSRSYRTILPNSLTMNHSSALVYSTQLPVSVYGTGTVSINDSGFSWKPVYLHIRACKHLRYYQVRLSGRICLPQSTSTPFNCLFRQAAEVSLLRPHFSQYTSNRILTVSSIGIAVRLILRPRLTLIRLTLIRNP